MAQIYLTEITAATDSSGATTVLRYATGKGYNHPSAAGFYEPRIIQAANMTREVFDDGKTFGASRVSYGETQLANPDGALDAVLNHGFGRRLKLLLGDDAAEYSTYAVVLDGTVEQPVADFSTMTFRARDRQLELETAIQPKKFAGTNSGASGIEGLADDLKGKPKPRVWGVVKEIAPFPVNTSALIFAVNFDKSGNTAAVTSFDGVFDAGVALNIDTAVGTSGDVASLSALQAATIAAGKYATCKAAGLFRLGSTPAGNITCNVTEGGASAADRYIGKILERLLLDAGVDAGDITATDITQLATDAPYQVGFYADQEINYRQVMDAIAESGGIWYSPNRLGDYRLKQIKAPAGSPAITLKRVSGGAAMAADEADIISIERQVTADQGRGVPAWKVNLNYQKVWATQSAGELAGSVTDTRRAYLAQEYRSVTAEDSAITSQFVRAPEMNFDTLIVLAADAQTECDRRLALYKVRREYFQVTVRLDTTAIEAIDLGSVIRLKMPRFGLDSGKLFIVTGITYNAISSELVLKIWG